MEVFSTATEVRQSLTQAILLYGSFATVHEIGTQKGQPVILPGTLATKEGVVAALRSILPKEERGTGLIPETLLASGVGHLIWWIPPSTRTLWFKSESVGGERSASVPLPGLVMLTVANQWMVFAVKGKGRPRPDTKLYQAPFFNVWERGRICQGTARVPEGDSKLNPQCWEEAFFRSYFTHPNIHTRNGLVKGSASEFWKDMLDGKYTKFPEQKLVKGDFTLGSLYYQYVSMGGE